MLYRIVPLLFLLIYPLYPTWAQCSLYEVSLTERIEASSLIVEGRVVSQRTYWQHDGRMIHTANEIEVYKVFKGSLRSHRLLILTPGGQIGFQKYVIHPSLKLEKGQAGIFFLKQASPSFRAARETLPQYEAYSSVQGYVQYDEVLGKARDPFHKYEDVEAELYRAISLRTGKMPRELSRYHLRPAAPAGTASRMTPVISNFSPTSLSAGTETVLTIDGSNFGTYDGGTLCTVFFSNADDGGATTVPCPASEINSWSDTQITLKVPYGAGTGTITVRNDLGNQVTSASSLTITFSHTNISSGGQRRITHLQDANGSGGYTLVYSTSTANNGVSFDGSSAVTPFAAALSTWQSGTLFNVVVSGTTASNTVDPNDGTNIVMFDNDAAPLPNGVLGRTTSGYGSCDGVVWFVNGFDLEFKRDGTNGISWNFGPAATGGCCYDFQSVAVHELGHAHQLGHVIASGNVMHYAIANGTDIRTLNAGSDIAGGNHVMTQSSSLNTCSGTVTGMSGYSTLPVELIRFEGMALPEANHLLWSTASEWAHRGFEVQKSDDGRMFRRIGFVPSRGYSQEVQQYAFEDAQLYQREHFYRLKSIDLDGKFEYSPTISISNPSTRPLLHLYPNPVHTQLEVSLGGRFSSDEKAIIRVLDPNGRQILQQIHTFNGENALLSLPACPPGIYYLQVFTPSGSLRLAGRFVKV